jgi:acyl-coenzyme A synthetase/AMP-(fatty) acid ligase
MGFVEMEINRIDGVVESVVFPSSHSIYGNVLKCVIYGDVEAEEVRERLKSRLEPAFIPSYIEVVDSPLKRTAAGKLAWRLYVEDI